jgi:hypothetical protein
MILPPLVCPALCIPAYRDHGSVSVQSLWDAVCLNLS